MKGAEQPLESELFKFPKRVKIALPSTFDILAYSDPCLDQDSRRSRKTVGWCLLHVNGKRSINRMM